MTGRAPHLSVRGRTAAIAAWGRARAWQRAAADFEAWRRPGAPPRPDAIAWTSAMRAVAAGRQWALALRYLAEMERSPAGLRPDIVTISTCASACTSARRWTEALRLFGELPSRGILPDLVAHIGAISACEVGECWQHALTLFGDLTEDALCPNIVAYGATISACSSASQWRHAVSLLQVLLSQGPAPNSVVFNSTITACARAQEWSRALNVFAALRQSAVMPDEVTFGAAIHACECGAQWAHALEIMWQCRADMEPSVSAFCGTARACGRAGMWQFAVLVLDSALSQQSLQPRLLPEVWSTVAWACEAAGIQPLPRPMSLSMLARKPLTLLAFVCRKVSRGDLDGTLRAIEEFASSHEWLKIAGGTKAKLLEACLRPGDRIVEFGTFVGYSALALSRRLRELGGSGRIVSCEVDAGTAEVAREIIAWAGVAAADLTVLIGQASDWAASGRLGPVDVLVLDHRGTRYHEDLRSMEGSLAPGARIVADNVLTPGAPMFVVHVDGSYDVAVHEVDEFLRPGRSDWMLVCAQSGREPDRCHLQGADHQLMLRPEDLQQWGAEIDRLCWQSSVGPAGAVHTSDWHELARRFAPVMRSWAATRWGVPLFRPSAPVVQAAAKARDGQPHGKRSADIQVFRHNRKITEFSRSAAWELALGCLRRMKDTQLKPDLITYTALANAFSKGSQWQKSLRLLGTVRHEQLAPDVMFFGAVVAACSQGHNWQLSLNVLEWMEGSIVDPNSITCGSMMTACEKSRQWQRSLALMALMQHRCIQQNTITYSAAVGACRRAEKWMEGIGLLHEMQEFSIQPSTLTYNVALSACPTWGGVGLLMDDMRKHVLIPNAMTYTCAINTCRRILAWEQSLQLLCQMDIVRFAPGGQTIRAVAAACADSGEAGLASQLSRQVRSPE